MGIVSEYSNILSKGCIFKGLGTMVLHFKMCNMLLNSLLKFAAYRSWYNWPHFTDMESRLRLVNFPKVTQLVSIAGTQS